MNKTLKKGIMAILAANIINLIFNLLTNFLLPKFLSVDSYAAIKTFQLYSTYVGIFALGYSDGMYLRYGGRVLESINQNELQTGMHSFRFMMIIESIILIPLALLSNDKIIIGFVFTIFTMNMINYYKNFYQAVGEFKLYGKILNWTTILTFAVNIFLLCIIRTDNYFIYLIGYAIVDAIIWIILEINKKIRFNKKISVNFSMFLLLQDIKSGFLLMIGNFSNILLSSMDRWFVKTMMDSEQFAYYSFAVSMEGFLNIAITPITTTMYNYFCNNLEKKDVIYVRKYVMIFGTIIAIAAFPAKFVIEIFLPGYLGAVRVLFILFATQMIYIVIKGIYVNLYKATKKQNIYFGKLVSILVIGAVINWVFVKIYPFKEAFAYGTLVSAFIWLIISIIDFKEYTYEIREVLYLILEVIMFIFLGYKSNSIIGFFAYIIISIFFMTIFMREEIKNIIKSALNTLRRN